MSTIFQYRKKIKIIHIISIPFYFSGCVSSLYVNEAIFLTTPVSPEQAIETTNREENYNNFTFITQYFADLDNKLSVKIEKDSANPQSVDLTITTIVKPMSRSYLYVKKNALFQDNIDISTDSNGLLNKADAKSEQKLTEIVTSISKAVGPIISLSEEFNKDKDQPNKKPVGTCQKAIEELPKVSNFSTERLSWKSKPSYLRLLENRIFSLRIEYPPFEPNKLNLRDKNYQGIVVFYPYPAEVSLYCYSEKISAPKKINVYMDQQVLYPYRDFLTNENHSFSITNGFYSGQVLKTDSAANTAVNTLTAPVKALVPTINVTNTITSVPGKSDEIKTTRTTSSPQRQ